VLNSRDHYRNQCQAFVYVGCSFGCHKINKYFEQLKSHQLLKKNLELYSWLVFVPKREFVQKCGSVIRLSFNP
jgi:hypothetical protein